MEVRSHFLQILEFLRHIFQKYSGIKFNENPSSGSRVVSCGRTDGHTDGQHKRRNYRGADKSLARPTSRCILFDGENISSDASLFMYINSTNITPIMAINWIYEHQNLVLL
jgi:hypothetical protein